MSDTWAALSARPWTGRVGRGIVYTPLARLGDWWCAGRDEPLILPGEPVPAIAGTPRMDFLCQLGRGRAEKEWLRYQRDIARYLIPLAEARAARDSARRRLEAARAHLGALKPPDSEDLRVRKSGETTDEAVVAARRMRAFEQRKQAAEARVQEFSAQVAEHEASVARLGEPIRVRFEVAKTRADLIDAYVRRRHAYYLTRLARKHADTSRFGPLVHRDWPDRPSWTTLPVSPDLGDSDA